MTKGLTTYGAEYIGSIHSVNEKRGTAKYDAPHPCGRCGGAGGSSHWKLTGWTCYLCGGHGHKTRTRTVCLYQPEQYAKLEATREKRKAALDVKRKAEAAIRAQRNMELHQERVAEFNTRNPGFTERLAAHQEKNPFLADLYHRLTQVNGYLSDAQVSSADSTIARIIAEGKAEWVGNVGQRVKMTITVDRVLIPEVHGFSPIPPSWTYLCHDESGNKIVYRGRSNAMPCTGETATLMVGIKDHTYYRDVKQTLIERPKAIAPIVIEENPTTAACAL